MRIWGLFMNSAVCTKDMDKNIERSKEISASLLSLIDDIREKTIFSIGGRGHYENPISTVLAFYLDPNEEHGLRDLVLQTLLVAADSCLKIERKKFTSFSVEREVSTGKGRIDLLVECDDWVLAIENKIYHVPINPFDDYKKYIKEKYDKFDFILLSPKGDKANDKGGDWKSVNYKDFIKQIESDLGFALIKQPINKWHFFFRDFLLNLKQYSEEGDMNKTTSDIKQIENKYLEIYEQIEALNEIRDHFFDSIIKKGLYDLNKAFDPPIKFKGQKYPKSDPYMVYFFPTNKGEVELAIEPSTDRKKTGVYLWLWLSDKVQERERAELSRRVGIKKWESEGTVSEERIKGAYKSVDEAIQALVELAKKIYPTKP